MAEYEINLENLVKMKRVFEEADEDGSGELDPDEFFEKLGPYLGQSLSPAAVSQLFMRIDADCGGTIDWEEFINYFFLQRASSSSADVGDDWRLHAEDHWRKEWRGAGHKEPVERVYCCTEQGQYITGGRCGVVKVWNAEGLSPVQTISNGAGWVTDCAFLECPAYKRLVVAAQDRTLSFYEPVRSTYEFSSRLSCPGSMGPPLCLAELQRDAGGAGPARLVWGDTEGAVMLLRADPPPLHTERQLVARRDFDVLHAGHTDWVTHLQHIPDAGLVSSSLDSTLRVLDLERGVLSATVTVHKKGVRTFAHSSAFSLVASGGVERSVLLWQPKGNVNKPVGELPGHSSGVAHLVVADEQSQVITLSEDHVVRVWDLRNHKCVQTIAHADWLRPEDSKPTAMAYDTSRRRLVCASHKPVAWSHRKVEVERQHDSRLVSALYNQTFNVVVSGDEGGTICMWNAQTGSREGGFSMHSKPAAAATSGAAGPRRRPSATLAPAAAPKLTAMTFDSNQRRLLTALDRGLVRVYNFNSGAVLREFVSREARQELTAVAFVPRLEAEEADGRAGEAEGGEQDAGEGQAAGGHSGVSGAAFPGQAADWAAGQPPGSARGGPWERGQLFGQGQELPAQELHRMLTPRGHHSQQQQQPGGSGSSSGGSTSREQDGELCGESNVVLATGWGRSLLAWQEGEEARVSSCARLAGHAADVLCMAVLGRDVVATGDFEGEVRVWHLPTATCLAAGSYGGPEFERAVRRLCWVPLAGAAAQTRPSSSPVQDAPTSSPRNAAQSAAVQHSAALSAEHALLLVAGDNGAVQVWQVPHQVPSSGSHSTAADACATPRGGGGEASSTPRAAACAQTSAVPVPADCDATAPAACRLVASFAAAHRRQDCVTALLLDDRQAAAGPEQLQHGRCLLWTGDSSGHVALWDLSPLVQAASQAQGCSAQALPGTHLALEGAPAGTASPYNVPPLALATPPASALPPQRLLHWHAAGASVVSLELMRAAGRGLVLVGGQDAGIGIWTRQGGLVGVFGRHTWDLDEPATWQDPEAAVVPPPLPANGGGTGLTPREIIASTPRRTNWVGSGAQTARQQSANARGGGALGSRPGSPAARGAQTARQLATRPLSACSRGAASTSAPPTARLLVQDTHQRQEQLLARLTQLRLPTPDERSGRYSPPPAALALPPPEFPPPNSQAQAAQPEAGEGLLPPKAPPTAAAGVLSKARPSVTTAVRQFLSPDSAGARLGALAAESAATKADRWSLPTYVQAHSALSLQRMDEVPADTGTLWAQIKAHPTGAERGRDRSGGWGGRSSVSTPAGRRPSTPPVSIAAIMGRGAAGLGRRASPGQTPPSQQPQQQRR